MIKAFTLFFSLILSMFIGVLQVQNKGLITAKLNANLDGLLSLDASAKAVYEGRAKYIKFIKTRPLEEVTFKSAFYVLKKQWT